MHSKWSEQNPVYGQRCSYVTINGSEGLWFSTNCSEAFPYICMNEEDIFILPNSATEALPTSIDSFTSTLFPNAAVTTSSAELHGKSLSSLFEEYM